MDQELIKENVKHLQELMASFPLRKFEEKSLKKLLRLSRVREYMEGDPIIEEGAQDPWIYFLISGKVKIERQGVEVGTIDKIGEIFGEMRILDGMGRSASVTSQGKTVCLAVNTQATGKMTSDERADLLLLLYRIFSEYIAIRLRLVNDELVRTKKELAEIKEQTP